MSKLTCPCGNRLSDVLYPGKATGILLSMQQVDRMNVVPGSNLFEGREVWECDKCGRIAFIHPGGSVKWYSPDDGQYGALMKCK